MTKACLRSTLLMGSSKATVKPSFVTVDPLCAQPSVRQGKSMDDWGTQAVVAAMPIGQPRKRPTQTPLFPFRSSLADASAVFFICDICV